MGGEGIIISSGYMKRTFKNLVPHDILYISFNYALNGEWQPNDYFSVDVDGVSSTSWRLGPTLQTTTGIQCSGSSTNTLVSYVVGKVFHTVGSVTVTINFSVTNVNVANIPSIAIRDVQLLARYRQSGDTQGLYVTIQDNSLPDSTKCNPNQYLLMPSLSCTSCSTTNCGICIGIGDLNCIGSSWAKVYTGSGYSSCAANCAFCASSTATDCFQCNPPYTLDYDNTCKSTCTLPYVMRGNNAYKCLMPCNATQYLYWNNTCKDSCDFPLQIDSPNQQCTYPCNKNYAEFLYWNGSCLTTCPFLQRNESGYAFCNACPEGYFISPDDGVTCKLGCNYPYMVKDIIFCKLDLSQSELTETTKVSTVNRVSNSILGVGGFLLSLLDPSDPSTFAFVAIVKMLLYIRYMDLACPPKLQSVLDQQNPNQPSVQFLKDAQGLIKDHLPKISIPGRFGHYKLHSNFLVNFFQPLLILLSILVITLILWMINYLSKPEAKFKPLVCKTLNTFKWNLLISLVVSNYEEFMSTSNDFHSFLYTLSYLTAMIALLVMVIISAIAIYVISSLRRATRQTNAPVHDQSLTDFKSQNIDYQVVYEAIKDSNLLQQSFFIIFTGRLIVFHIIIACLISKPFIQAVLILLMNILMVLYLFMRTPIKNKFKLVQQILQELILLVVNTCVLMIASLDLSARVDSLTRRIAGEIILYSNLLLSLLGPVFIVLLIILELLAIRRKNKIHSESSVVAINRNTDNISVANQNRDRGPSFSQRNNESIIQLVQMQLDQSQLRESPSVFPQVKHKLDSDQQILNISNQSRLRGQVKRKGGARNLPQTIQEPSLLVTRNLDSNQANSKRSGKSINKDGENKD